MTGSPDLHPRSKAAWNVLVIALLIEAFGGLALLVQTVFGLLNASNDPLGDRLSVFISVLIAWIWVVITLFAGMRSKASWVRGSAVTIHVLLFAAGTGMLQFGIGTTLLSGLIVVLALVGFFAAIIAKPVAGDTDFSEGATSGDEQP